MLTSRPVHVVVVGTLPGTNRAKIRARIEAYGATMTASVDADTRVLLLGLGEVSGGAVRRAFNAACKRKSQGADMVIVHHVDALWAALAALRPCAPPTPLLPRGQRADSFQMTF
jgi:hypothetical protein